MTISQDDFERVQKYLWAGRTGEPATDDHTAANVGDGGAVSGGYGYTHDKVKEVPTPDDQVDDRVRRVFELAHKGWSLARIAAHLNEMDTDGSR